MGQLAKQQPEMEIISANTAALCDACKAALDAEDQAKSAVQYLIRTKIIAGQMLEAKKEGMERGDWTEFCKNVLPISHDTASRWINLFKFVRLHGEDALDDAKSVRQAYVLAGLLPESQGGSAGGSPTADAYLTDLVRTDTRLKAQLAKRPLSEWARDELRTLRERLKPLVELYVEVNAIA